MDRNRVIETGQELYDALAPNCARIQIAGSVRRGKPDPKDLEIVAIPHVVERVTRDMFGLPLNTVQINQVEAFALPSGWTYLKNGKLYKQAQHEASGLKADLFFGTVRNWGAMLTIRTGPGEYSKALATLVRRLGWQMSGGYYVHQHPVKHDPEGKTIPCRWGDECSLIYPTPEESDFYAALGISYVEPARRDARQIWSIIHQLSYNNGRS